MTRTMLCLVALALAGCGDSTTTDGGAGGNDAATGADAASGDAGEGADAGDTDAGDTDAGETADAGETVDAGGSDGGGTDGGACADCFPRAWEFGYDGGFTPERRRTWIESCQGFRHTRTILSSGGTMRSCTNEVPGCDDTSGAITVDQVVQAFAHPDVVAALGDAPVLYGRDSRPVDGVVFQFQEVGGPVVEVGGDCTGGAGCTPVPAGVRALTELLLMLQEQQLGVPDCSTVFPAP